VTKPVHIIVNRLSPISHPTDDDAVRPAQAAGKYGGVMLDVPNVNDLVLQRGHLVPGEAALRSREVKPIDPGIDHIIALLAVLKQVITSERFTSFRGPVTLPTNTAYVISFLAMPGPWDKSFLTLLEVKMSIEERMVGHAPEPSGAIRGVVPHPVRAFLDRIVQGLQGRVVLGLEG
jgi:hypothetical protein